MTVDSPDLPAGTISAFRDNIAALRVRRGFRFDLPGPYRRGFIRIEPA
jgi:hypothetical protein